MELLRLFQWASSTSYLVCKNKKIPFYCFTWWAFKKNCQCSFVCFIIEKHCKNAPETQTEVCVTYNSKANTEGQLFDLTHRLSFSLHRSAHDKIEQSFSVRRVEFLQFVASFWMVLFFFFASHQRFLSFFFVAFFHFHYCENEKLSATSSCSLDQLALMVKIFKTQFGSSAK